MNAKYHPFTTHLESLRLRFRPLETTDAQAIYAIRKEPSRWTYFDTPPYSEFAEAIRYVAKIRGLLATEAAFFWALETRASGEMVGTLCFFQFSEDRSEAEFGYEVGLPYAGQGYMKEAIAAALRFGFQSLCLVRIHAVVHYENQASVHLLRRAGFVCVGSVSEEKSTKPSVLHRYELTRLQWEERQ